MQAASLLEHWRRWRADANPHRGAGSGRTYTKSDRPVLIVGPAVPPPTSRRLVWGGRDGAGVGVNRGWGVFV